jgi:alkylation response protein AidB-like acyl-CoA dehydrogenase
MDLEYSADERQVEQALQRFFEGSDRVAIARRAGESSLGYDKVEHGRLADAGWFRLAFDTVLGGIGPGGAGTMLLAQACGRHLVTGPCLADLTMAGSVLAAVHERGHETAGARLDALLQGTERIALASGDGEFGGRSEPDGSSAAMLADRTSTGAWRLSGTRSRVVAGSGIDALVVSAPVNRGGNSSEHSPGLFLVPVDASGLQIEHERMIDGRIVSSIRLTQVEVPQGARLDDGTDGAELLALARNRALLAGAAENLGAMQILFESTLDYVKTREQFGQPIGRFQALQHRLVDMSIRLDEAHVLVSAAAIALDESLADPAVDEATVASSASPMAATAAIIGAWIQSLWSGRQILEESIQLHGAIGMTHEFAVGHYAKRILVNEILLGGADTHLARFQSLRRRRT